MNKVLATPKGFILLIDHAIPRERALDLSIKLEEATGVKWGILTEVEFEPMPGVLKFPEGTASEEFDRLKKVFGEE